jgi:glycosyltransferase involved in cell wall biosynthesis
VRGYYMVPNQFWPHKNHLVVLKCLQELKLRGVNLTVVFTGKEETGDGSYSISLRKFVSDNGLQQQVRFLGFIDRIDQLVLMRESIAIIQPSLFEGWSTVVEDAKALGKFVFASDLAVHREQLAQHCCFFKADDEMELASLIMKTEVNDTLHFFEYEENRRQFGKSFYNAIQT